MYNTFISQYNILHAFLLSHPHMRTIYNIINKIFKTQR